MTQGKMRKFIDKDGSEYILDDYSTDLRMRVMRIYLPNGTHVFRKYSKLNLIVQVILRVIGNFIRNLTEDIFLLP